MATSRKTSGPKTSKKNAVTGKPEPAVVSPLATPSSPAPNAVKEQTVKEKGVVTTYPYFETFRRNSTNLIAKIKEDNAHMVWAIGLYLEEPDLEALASEALVDTNNDKGIDFLYIDRDEKKLIVAQGYYASKPKDSAPDSKAAVLNQSVAWLFSGELDSVPESLRDAIAEFRRANAANEVDTIELLFVHNLSSSINVNRELKTAAKHLQSTVGDTNNITVIFRELSASSIQGLYASQESHIDVKGLIHCPAEGYIEQNGPNWKAVVTSVQGKWLHKLFAEYDEALFSANYRGFLGIKRRKINSAIKGSAENAASDFWVYNNGITLLTLGIEHKVTGKDKGITLDGVSVINGAQTTGSIGKVDIANHNLENVKVLCRIIRCDDPEKVDSIVKYNNTQNNITTWDQYSGDPEQVRIEEEFNSLGHTYSRKRGFRTNNNLDQIGIEDVVQPLVAFKGRYGSANAGKNNIFERTPLYKLAFDNKKARHVLLVYCFARAIDERRLELKTMSNLRKLIPIEEQHLRLLRHLRFKNFFLALIPRILDTVVGWRIDSDTIAFNPKAAKAEENSLADLVAACLVVINKVLTFVSAQLKADDLYSLIQREGESKDEPLDKLADAINTQLYITDTEEIFKNFRALVSES
jgi:hypothetical protein